MATVYVIRDWDDHFENSQSRKVGSLTWVGIPNKHDGKSYRRIMARPDGPQIFAAWILMVQIASKCPQRGVLSDRDGPLLVEDWELKTGCPKAVFENALEVLTSPEVRWVLVADWESTRGTSALGGERRGGDGMGKESPNGDCGERSKGATAPPAASEYSFPVTRQREEWVLSADKLAEYIGSFPGLDVHAELRKARQWCRDNPTKRKTPTGMLGFLTRWLSSAQNRGYGHGAPQPSAKKLPPTPQW